MARNLMQTNTEGINNSETYLELNAFRWYEYS